MKEMRPIRHGEDYTLDEAEQMLDWITGDSPPDLEHWNCRDWMNLHRQFHRLKSENERLRKHVPAPAPGDEKPDGIIYDAVVDATKEAIREVSRPPAPRAQQKGDQR